MSLSFRLEEMELPSGVGNAAAISTVPGTFFLFHFPPLDPSAEVFEFEL